MPCAVSLLTKGGALGLLAAMAAQAVEVRFERVAEGVYAFVGETGARSAANEGSTPTSLWRCATSI